jgi:hypothetical protein
VPDKSIPIYARLLKLSWMTAPARQARADAFKKIVVLAERGKVFGALGWSRATDMSALL